MSSIKFEIITLVLCVVSFVTYIYLNSIKQTAAFYLMPTRLWELGLGSLIFSIVNRKKKIKIKFINSNATFIGFLLCVSLFIPAQHTVSATICVVLLTGILIANSNQNNYFIYNILTSNAVVYVGLISYSLYLWHWPVIVLSRWTIGFAWWSVPIQISLIILFSIFSYHVIESPIRKYKGVKNNLVIIFFAIIFILCASAFLLAVWKYNDSLFLGVENKSESFANVESTQVNRESCHSIEPLVSADKCKILVENKNTIYFSGDSHTLHLHHAAKYISDKKIASIQIHSVGASPFPSFAYTGWGYNDVSRDKYTKLQEQRMSYILDAIVDGDILVISTILQDYLNKNNYYSIQNGMLPITPQQAIEDWKNKVLDLASKLEKKKARLIIFMPLPRYSNAKFGIDLCRPQWFRLFSCDSSDIVEDRAPLEVQRKFATDLLQELSNNHKNIFLFDPFESLCSRNEDKCGLMLNGNLIFYDNTHLSNKISKFIGMKFSEYLVGRNFL